MKRTIRKFFTFALLAVGFVAGSNVKASAAKLAIDATNFPDTAIRNALVRDAEDNYDDTDANGKYSKAADTYYVNTDEITYITVFEQDGVVNSVDCLKVFPNLNEVNLYDINATELKFADSVTSVYLSGIPSSSFKVEANNLKTFAVNASKGHGAISMPNMANLTSLHLFNVKLASFDASQCPKLVELSLCETQTSSIKGLENLKNLNYINISSSTVTSMDLSASKNLQTVYVGSNKKLTSVKLPNSVKIVYLSDNDLKSINVKGAKNLNYLNVSGNKNLKSLDISKNTKLYGVYLSNTKVSKLNTSKNTKLTSISCYKTKVKSLNISKNKKLNTLNVSDNKSLKSLNVKNNKNLTDLNYYGSGIKKLNLSKQKEISLTYDGVKKGKSISLKNIIGTGYKVTYSYGGIKYNKKNGSFKVTKKGYAYLTLKKGKLTRYISVSVK